MSNVKYIIHNRFDYYSRTTIGNILVDGTHFCYTLEDTVRGEGIKVYGETAIPCNPDFGYNVGIKFSQSFNRNVINLYTESDKRTLIKGGISFTDIYLHGLNDHSETKGCIGVAHQQYKNKIWNSAENEIFILIKNLKREGFEVRWLITNSPQEK